MRHPNYPCVAKLKGEYRLILQ